MADSVEINDTEHVLFSSKYDPHHITLKNKIKFFTVNVMFESTPFCSSSQLHVTTTASKQNSYVPRTRDFQLLINAFQ